MGQGKYHKQPRHRDTGRPTRIDRHAWYGNTTTERDHVTRKHDAIESIISLAYCEVRERWNANRHQTLPAWNPHKRACLPNRSREDGVLEEEVDEGEQCGPSDQWTTTWRKRGQLTAQELHLKHPCVINHIIKRILFKNIYICVIESLCCIEH